jgi:NAD-dependent DNA ligase
MYEIENACYVSDFYGRDLDCLDRNSIINLFNIKEENFDKLILTTIKKCHLFGKTFLFRSNLNYYEDRVSEIGVIGIYLLLHLNSDLKRYSHFSEYIPYFKELSFNLSLSLLNKFVRPKAKKRKAANPNFNFEDKPSLELKTVSPELRNPDLNDVINKGHIFYDKNIVITGTFESYPVRNDMAEIIFSVGGKTKSSVNKLTDYVVLGENAGPSKIKIIEDLNIKTINEKEFLDIFDIN